MPRAILPLAVLAVLISLVAAFAPGPRPRGASVGALLGVPLPVPGGTYRAPLTDDPPTFDPALAADTTSLTCILQLYDGLVRFQEGDVAADGGMKVTPALARRWTISNDGLTYTFELRRGVRFQAPPGSPASWNRPVTAADVKYSFERVLWPEVKSPAATTFMPILGSEAVQAGTSRELAGITLPDEDTVQIRLKAPFAPFLSSLTMPNAFIVQREAIEAQGRSGGLWPTPVGTGPFMLADYVPEARVVMVRNPSYWDQSPGMPPRPYLDRLIFEIQTDEDRRFRAFEEEKLHHTEVPDPVYERVENHEHLVERNQLGTYYVGFQVQSDPFDDLRVRQAFSHAIHKSSIVEFIRAGRVQAARGPLPPNIPGYDPNLDAYDYETRKAEQLLDEAGYPRDPETGLRSGFPAIDLDVDTDESNYRVAQAVQANLMDIGVKIGIVRRPWGQHLERVRSGASPFHRLGWVADYLDADNFLYYNFFSGNIGSSNGNFYMNRDVDRLLQEAREINNMSRRLKLYAKAEQLITYDAPWICLFYYQTSLLRRPEVHGLNLTALGAHMIRYDTVWLDRPAEDPSVHALGPQ